MCRILLLLLLPCFSDGQTGTLIISAITDKEIIIAVDSRGSFYNPTYHSKEPSAYFDSVCKTFQIKQFAVAIAGSASIGYDYYSKIISVSMRQVTGTQV